MKQIKSIILVAALILTMCLGLIMPAAAAESAVLWLEVQTNETGVLVKVCANTTLTDGRIDVRYDYRTMSYSDIAVAEEYVLAHAVNAEKGGVVQIAWVASGDYNMDGKDHVLMQLQFAGENIDGYSVSGYAFSPEGTQYTVTPPEGLDRLLAAVESAKALKS